MAIVCGTDLSPAATEAANAAACLAARQRLPLYLVHAVDSTQVDQTALIERTERHLQEQAAQLRKLGAEVNVTVRSGAPDGVLIEVGKETHARLVVVGAHGEHGGSGRKVGVHTERVAQRAGVAVLVVRDAAPFRAWTQSERGLRVLLGVEPSFSTQCAVSRLQELRALGACDVTAVRLYWPPSEFQRLGFSGARSYTEIDPAVTQVLVNELKDRIPALQEGAYKLRVEPHLGSLGERLASIATEEKADLIVVGSHDKSVVERLWEGSISHATLHNAHTAVLCVPEAECPSEQRRRRAKSIVVATDFSRLGDSGVPLAYAIAEAGATLHVLHVVPPREHTPLDFHDIFVLDNLKVPSSARDEALKHLRQLTSQVASSADKHIELHVLESDGAADAIAQAAERLAADVIVVGTHGRSGLSKALLGSVASSVLHTSKRPVLLVRDLD